MRPSARIVIDGRDVSTQIFGGEGVLVSLTVTDEAGTKSDTLELELDDREGFKAPTKGAEIQCWLGFEPQPTYMGRFKVDEWTKRGPVRTLHISAKAAELTTDIRAPRTKSWHDKTLGSIVQEVAGKHGLSAQVESSIASKKIDHIDQQHESDLGFLSRLAKRNGATFKLADGKVIFAKTGSKTLPSGGSKPTLLLTPDMCIDWTATSQNRGDYESASAEYHDHKKGQRKRVKVGSGKPEHRQRVLYASKNEAQRAAQGNLRDLKRGKANMTVNAGGLPDFFSGAMANVQGFDPDVDGEYLIKTVTHTLENGGYRTALSLETMKGVDETDAPEDTESSQDE